MEAEKSAIDVRRLESIYEEVKGKIGEVMNRIDKQVERVEQATRERPSTTLAVTFTAGAIIGGLLTLLLSRRKD